MLRAKSRDRPHGRAGRGTGVIAAQSSIGEPGTQLTLRTFHIGGVAGRIVEQSKIKAKTPGKVVFRDLELVERASGHLVVVGHKGQMEIPGVDGKARHRYSPPYGATIHVRDNQPVVAGDDLFEWDSFGTPILTEKAGTVRFVDIKEKVTVRDEVDENTGLRLMVIIDDREKVLHPHVDIVGSGGRRIAGYPLPTGARLLVRDGQEVTAGEALVKIRREITKTRDITGGLPRVSELFEARKPKDAATVAEIDGRVEFGGVSRGMKKLLVVGDNGETREYLIPQGKHLHVQEGDSVRAGDRLTEGPVNPHDTLKIKESRRCRSTWSTRSRRSTDSRECGSTTSTSRSSSGRCCRRSGSRIRRHDLPRRGAGRQEPAARGADPRGDGGRPAGHLSAAPAWDYQGVAVDPELHLLGFVPETTRVLTRLRARHDRSSPRLEGERDHRAPHPRGHRDQQVQGVEVVTEEEDEVEKPTPAEEEAKSA